MIHELYYLSNKIILLGIMSHKEFWLFVTRWRGKPWNTKDLRGEMDNSEDKPEKAKSPLGKSTPVYMESMD